MKKLIFQLAMLILSMQCVASNYRGMFEVGAGPMFANEVVGTSTGKFKYKKTTFGGLFTTSHGCQFTPWLFAGAGAGISCEWVNSSNNKDSNIASKNVEFKNHLISVPLFVDVRWDLDVNRKATPYAGLKLGYQLGMNSYATYKAYSVANPSYVTAGLMKSADGMYMQISAGVKWKVGENTGINLGLSYSPLIRREIHTEGTVFANRNFLTINAGIDIQGTWKSSTKESRKEKLYRLQQRQLKKQLKNSNQ